MFIAYIPVLMLLISVSLNNRIVLSSVRLNFHFNAMSLLSDKIAKPIADLGSFQRQVFNFTVAITADLHIVLNLPVAFRVRLGATDLSAA